MREVAVRAKMSGICEIQTKIRGGKQRMGRGRRGESL